MPGKLAVCAVALSILVGCSARTSDPAAESAAPAGAAAPPPTSTPPDPHFTGANSERFCALARTYDDSFAGIGSSPTSAQLRTVATEGQRSIDEALNAAPGEIRDDVQLVARTFGAFLGDLQKVEFEVAKLPTNAVSRFTAPDFQAATKRFDAYIRTVCGAS
jgi:hypothetical protein